VDDKTKRTNLRLTRKTKQNHGTMNLTVALHYIRGMIGGLRAVWCLGSADVDAVLPNLRKG